VVRRGPAGAHEDPPAEGTKPKYAEAFRDRPGMFPDPAVIEPGAPLVIVEGEFDALLLGQELRRAPGLPGWAAVVTLGSASSRPNLTTRSEMLASTPWFIATDADEAGDKAASDWPAVVRRVRPPGAFKDWTEAAQAGVNLRRWWSDRLGGTEAPALFSWPELAAQRWGPALNDPTPGIIIDQSEPSRVFVVDSSGTAEQVEAAPSMGPGTVTLPEATSPPSEGQAAPRTPYWTAPDLSPADVSDIEAIRELLWDGTSLAESIEAGRRWNASVLSRRTGRGES